MKKQKHKSTADILNELSENGHRLTKPRIIILEALVNSTDHPSAEDIYFTVHGKCHKIGLTTVYRTLDLLVSWGFVHKFDFGDGKARYEFIDNPNGLGHHHHLICRSCKKIINYNDFLDEEIKLVKKTEKSLSKKYNFTIDTHNIEFYGTCEECG